MISAAWSFLKRERNQSALHFIGRGIAIVVVAGWTVFMFLDRDGDQPAKSQTAIARDGGVAVAGNVETINVGPNDNEMRRAISDEQAPVIKKLSDIASVCREILASIELLPEKKTEQLQTTPHFNVDGPFRFDAGLHVGDQPTFALWSPGSTPSALGTPSLINAGLHVGDQPTFPLWSPGSTPSALGTPSLVNAGLHAGDHQTFPLWSPGSTPSALGTPSLINAGLHVGDQPTFPLWSPGSTPSALGTPSLVNAGLHAGDQPTFALWAPGSTPSALGTPSLGTPSLGSSIALH